MNDIPLVECSILVSVPGQYVPDPSEDWNWRSHQLVNNPLIKRLTDKLDEIGRSWKSVDTASGWGNLNQDWIEFHAWVETSWGWCMLAEGLGDYLTPLLREGKLIMMVYYIKRDEKGNIVEYIDHH